jgi:hypothetical protein
MKNKIEILCPSKRCPRCRKFIAFIESEKEKNGWDTEIIVYTKLKDFINFNTWILPSVFVNNVKVSRGYKPTVKSIEKHLRR